MNSNIKKKLFTNIYNRSDLFYVLSEDFKSSLKKIGITKKINVIKTTFDGDKYQSLGKKDGLLLNYHREKELHKLNKILSRSLI